MLISEKHPDEIRYTKSY